MWATTSDLGLCMGSTWGSTFKPGGLHIWVEGDSGVKAPAKKTSTAQLAGLAIRVRRFFSPWAGHTASRRRVGTRSRSPSRSKSDARWLDYAVWHAVNPRPALTHPV